ncbi:MAG: hypothetical protein JJU16_00705 [Alkalibacterium sp.]|nr:hypothetical protein [Alkalibacterium sp.]
MSEKSIFIPLQKTGVNANVLKTVAVLAMFIDHASHLVTEFGTSERWIAHLIGRLAAPLIFFLVAEGHHYTSDKKKYIMRLFIFALISHVPYNLYFGFSQFRGTSVIWTIMLGVVALSVITSDKLNVFIKTVLIGATLLMAMPANWHYIGVLWIIAFGLYRDNLKLKVIMFTLIALVFYILPGLQDIGMYATYRFGVLMTIPFFILYNRKPGVRNPFTKWVFYWFYPIHLIVLFGIRALMNL